MPCKALTILLIILQMLYAPNNSFGQLSGIVVDEQKVAVQGASVYVSNTTYGTTSSDKGIFSVTKFPKPPFQLTISCIGYESKSIAITDTLVQGMSVVLKQKANDINEIVIRRPDKNGWEKYGKEFFSDFIGYSKFASQTEILNKEVLEFAYNPEQMTLHVNAVKPIKIRNKATGYIITYWLEDYQKDYISRKIFYKGTLQFDAMASKKEKVNARWESNRVAAYQGSLHHFMRSVYRDEVYKDSFELRVYRKINAAEYGKTIPFKTLTIKDIRDTNFHTAFINFLGYEPIDLAKFLSPLKQWLDTTDAKPKTFKIMEKVADSSLAVKRHILLETNPENLKEKRIQFFDYDFVPEDTTNKQAATNFKLTDASGKLVALPKKKAPSEYAYLYTQKIPLDSFVNRHTNGKVEMKFKDYLQVTFLPEVVEPEFVRSQFGSKKFYDEPQTSLLRLENKNGITILPNGNFYEPYDLHIEAYWSYEKIDKMLPLNYEP